MSHPFDNPYEERPEPEHGVGEGHSLRRARAEVERIAQERGYTTMGQFQDLWAELYSPRELQRFVQEMLR